MKKQAAAEIKTDDLLMTLLNLVSDVMRSRSGNRLDNVAELQRLVARLSDELAQYKRDAADELWSAPEVARLTGVSEPAVRHWVKKQRIGFKDRRGVYQISKAKLHAFLLAKYGGVLPGHLAEAFR